jgi:hypothetical protein
MRLSGLAVAAVLAASTFLFAQHSSGGSAGGGGHAASFGGSNVSHSVPSMSSASRGSGPINLAHSSPSSPSKSFSSKDVSTGQKSSRSFFHPFRKPVTVKPPEFSSRVVCLKAPCAVCPPGQARGWKGGCFAQVNACQAGQSWNGFTCGVQGFLDDCTTLARELVRQKQLMRSQHDYGQGLQYQWLMNRYQQCLMRSRSALGPYALNGALLLDTP